MNSNMEYCEETERWTFTHNAPGYQAYKPHSAPPPHDYYELGGLVEGRAVSITQPIPSIQSALVIILETRSIFDRVGCIETADDAFGTITSST